MFCRKCGTKLEDGTKFCPQCGTSVDENKSPRYVDSVFGYPTSEEKSEYNPSRSPQQQQQQQMPHQQDYGTSDNGIYGVLGLVFAFLIPIVGLILSIYALKKGSNRGLAVAGIIVSVAIMVISAIVSAVLINKYLNILDYYIYDYRMFY